MDVDCFLRNQRMGEKSHVVEVGKLHDDTPLEYPDLKNLLKPNVDLITPQHLQKHGIHRLTTLRFKYFVAKASVLNFFMSVLEFILGEVKKMNSNILTFSSLEDN